MLLVSEPVLGTEEKAALAAVIESGWITMGDRVREFEKAFALLHQAEDSIAVNSCTAALHLILHALGIGPGDEVLLPGYMWCSCISAVIRLGAIPRLVDIDQTFCMDPHDLKRKLTPHSKAVLIVHMSGAPGNIEELVQIARAAGLAIVEDCAQSNGASIHGRLTGTFGDIAASLLAPPTLTASATVIASPAIVSFSASKDCAMSAPSFRTQNRWPECLSPSGA